MKHGEALGWYALGGLAVMLVLSWAAYAAGLGGGFLFDDYVNLNALGSSGPIDSWATFWRYLSGGTADPTGRPLSLLTFLLDARDWPADPAPFLRTNLLIHSVNGILLFLLVRALESQLSGPCAARRTLGISLLAATAWLLHPLFVSTTLYIVQREAMLPATFALLGLLGYTVGRVRFVATNGRRGIATMCLSIVLGTGLAVLSKANGILLPLLAWSIEVTVFRTVEIRQGGHRPTRTIRCLLVIPSLFIITYIASHLADWNTVPEDRTWSVGQRVLTEGRVLLDYLHLLVVPRSLSSGLFNDNYLVSTGLLKPISTLPSWTLVAVLVLSAVRYRTRFPATAAAILFFFAGHLLESTTLPLELYFEHRNYLPALLLGWPVARALASWPVASGLRIGASGALICLLAWTTHLRAQAWGEPDRLANLWVTINPQSSRAQTMVAMQRVSQGRAREALDGIAPRWRAHPNDVQLAASYFAAACRLPRGLSHEDMRALESTVRQAIVDQETMFRWLDRAIQIASAQSCHGLTLDGVESWVRAAGSQPVTREAAMRVRESLLGKIELYRGNPERALAHFDRQFRTNPLPETAAIQSALLASEGYFDQALSHLETYEHVRRGGGLRRPGIGMPWVREKILAQQDYWTQEMNFLKSNYKLAQEQISHRP